MIKYLCSKACLCYIPVLLLTAVALTQLYLAHNYGLSPWTGGGFGMFSTTDAPRRRHVHAYSMSPGVRREIVIPDHLRDTALRAAALPTETHLTRLAAELADLPSPERGTARSIIIQVWKTEYDPAFLVPSGSMVRSLEVPLEGN
ncbi:MAG: hypothetical protein L0213_14905 [Candidatus Dadabacteria bacterium]|nr:hypothetical protein [Candidatus Dadabacteria bacterium]